MSQDEVGSKVPAEYQNKAAVGASELSGAKHPSTSSIEKVLTSRPIDATAARVTSEGPKWVSLAPIRDDLVCSPVPLATVPLKRGGQNFIGQRIGSLTVVGLYRLKSESVGRRYPRRTITYWSCRCQCGYYVVRKALTLRNAKNPHDCCARCNQARKLAAAASLPERPE